MNIKMIPATLTQMIVCCVAILLSSCNTDEQPIYNHSSTIDSVGKKADDAFNKLNRAFRFVDSNLKYGRLAREAEIKC